MTLKISKQVKIGFVSVLALGLLIWGANFMKGRDIFNQHNTFYAVYDEVNGLVETNPVLVNGLKVGLVKDIHFKTDGSNKIVITIHVDKDIRVPKNSVARIFSSDLMGSKAVEIALSKSTELAKEGDTLGSELQATLQEEVNRQVLPLKMKTESLISSIDSLLTSIRSVLNKNTRDNLEKSFESIKTTINNLEHMTFNLDTLVITEQTRMKRILGNVESITFNLKNSNDKIKNVIDNFSAISDSIAKSNLTQTIQNADKALGDFAIVMEKVKKGEGSLGMLVNNDSLYKNLNSSSKNLNELMEDMKLNPNRYVHVSVFGRNPKKDPYVKPGASNEKK